MDNFALISIFGVLALYFYSTSSNYKAQYFKLVDEKKLVEEKNANLEKLKTKYDQQIKFSLETIDDSQSSLQSTREDLQKSKLEIAGLERRNKQLQDRVNELYASVGSIN